MIIQADEAEKERALQELEKQREREVRRRIYKVPKPSDELCIMKNARRTIQDEYTKYQSEHLNKPSDELCIMNNARRTIQEEYTNVSRVNNTTQRKGKAIKKVKIESKKLTMKSRVCSEMKTWK